MNIKQNVTELIGNTPLVKINNLSKESGAEIIGKCEFLNPSSSVKDRIANNMIENAISKGIIKEGTTVIEPTSGNTGIGLAMVCAAKNIKLILTMPESMSMERRQLLSALGAKLDLTEAPKGMKGAVERANELNKEIPDSIVLQQFENPANSEIHRLTTAEEILRDTDGKIDIFISAIGTGGTITGVGEVLKEKVPGVQIIGVEPEKSPVLSGGSPSPHKIQGIGAGFVPGVLNTKIYDEMIQVKDEDAFATSAKLAKEEGLLVGISAGANAFIASEVAKRPENKGKTIVTVLCDTGERYLSTALYQNN